MKRKKGRQQGLKGSCHPWQGFPATLVELKRKVDDSLMPSLSKLPGFSGYYLIEAGDGVMSSINLFDTSAQADESNRVAATWLREEKLEAVLPNPPKVTGGEVIVHETNGAVRA